ncbi:hypothetical protein [uncultured Methylobacterium sp.]|uniref:hypothetical protein n=1 Tax=uncultured Methylobacterium sp. TaxID=157278 RepID=UPI0035CAEBD9
MKAATSSPRRSHLASKSMTPRPVKSRRSARPAWPRKGTAQIAAIAASSPAKPSAQVSSASFTAAIGVIKDRLSLAF